MDKNTQGCITILLLPVMAVYYGYIAQLMYSLVFVQRFGSPPVSIGAAIAATAAIRFVVTRDDRTAKERREAEEYEKNCSDKERAEDFISWIIRCIFQPLVGLAIVWVALLFS